MIVSRAFVISGDPDIHAGYIFVIQTYENLVAYQWNNQKLFTTLFENGKIMGVQKIFVFYLSNSGSRFRDEIRVAK